MSNVASELQTAVVAQFDDFIDGVFAPLEAWLPKLQSDLGTALKQGPLNGAQLTALVEKDAHSVLRSAERPIYGAGFCATADVVNEGNPLAWWQGPDRALLASSTFGPGQAAIDLHRLEWYRVPAQSLERHVAGPFVDYLCSNEITLTVSLPLSLDEQFSGVMCADVVIASIEEQFLPLLNQFDEAAIINLNGRVVVSTDAEHETGDRYVGNATLTRSSRYPFALAVSK